MFLALAANLHTYLHMYSQLGSLHRLIGEITRVDLGSSSSSSSAKVCLSIELN